MSTNGSRQGSKGSSCPLPRHLAASRFLSNRVQLEQGASALERDTAPDGPAATAAHQSRFAKECYAIRQTFFSQDVGSLVAINCLLAFVPLGIAAGHLAWGCLMTFGFNCLAIMPLAAMLSTSTAALSVHTGQLIGGLLNATLGNAVEMSVTIIAIRAGFVEIVQMSLIGSVFSNLLLVLGVSFMCAGVKHHQSTFSAGGASANLTCLVLASLALTLPTVFNHIPGTTSHDNLMLSRIIALVMAFVYICFLIFQLGTHATLFREAEEAVQEVHNGMIHPVTAAVALTISVVSVVLCSDYLVDSIRSVSDDYGMPYAFIGLIVLPVVGNAAEHTTAVTAAYHNMMDLSMSVAIGSSTQIALFVIPFSIIVGWICDVPLGLDFEIFSTTVFVLSVFIASSVLSDGSGNWFEGLMLVATYVIVAIIAWYIPAISGRAVHERLLSVPHQGLAMEAPVATLNTSILNCDNQTTLLI